MAGVNRPNPKDLKGAKKQLNPYDAKKHDFVWKESDTKKNSKGQKVAIVLFPRSFGKPKRFKWVELRAAGKVVSKLRWVYYEIEHGKPERQVWRTELAPKDLPKTGAVLMTDTGHWWFLPDPRKRID